MANSNWEDMPESVRKRFLKEGIMNLDPHALLSKTLFMPMERKKLGKWEALWLKLTFRKPPMVYVLPQSKGDTITIRRPHAYRSNSDPAPDQPKPLAEQSE